MFFSYFCMDLKSEINNNIIIVELRIYGFAGKKYKTPSMPTRADTVSVLSSGDWLVNNTLWFIIRSLLKT